MPDLFFIAPASLYAMMLNPTPNNPLIGIIGQHFPCPISLPTLPILPTTNSWDGDEQMIIRRGMV